MIARRDVFKIGAALGLTAAVPAAELSAALDAVKDRAKLPVPAGVADSWEHNPAVYDPAAFPHEVLSLINGYIGDLIYHEAPAEYAAYKQARARLVDAMPELRSDYQTPFELLDEAAYAFAMECYQMGLEAGAALEQMRHALTRRGRICPACHGHGRDGSLYHAAPSADPCQTCGGKGTVGGE